VKTVALLQDLIKQVEDLELRERILREVDKMSKQKKFGLVFEEHLPECTPLYHVKIKRGSKVSLKTGKVDDIYIVRSIDGDKTVCEHRQDHHVENFPLDELVAVAEFGEPIYPYLKPIDSVCNAPDSDLWHTLIEADNYHALQLLEYLYAEKVDCIYIDPPYNTGARDWKYNNDYVDSSDQYRHSKWLSFMEKRLKLAKKLLNPEDSVLIVTIDEKEYLHLGCLLEEIFPEAQMQMISSVMNPKGAARHQQFGRTDEYIFFVQFGGSCPSPLPLSNEWKITDDKRASRLRWKELLRSGSHTARADSPNQFYPVFITNTSEGPIFHSVGDTYFGSDWANINAPEGCYAVWPIRADGSEGNWQISSGNLRDSIKLGYAKLGKWRGSNTTITYLAKGERNKIANGAFKIIGHRQDGSVIADDDAYVPRFIPGTQWRIKSHNAEQGGTNLIKKMLGEKRFTFPKSLYAEEDAIRFYVANKPNALIIDFFAGSGTTLHAVNLLNAEDGGHRRCIMVTNNEVSATEAKALTKQGYKPGDEEWEKLGIARYVTWPRTVCSIEGRDVNEKPLKGNYIGSDIPMADGFKANAAYFKLGFLDKNAVALGRQFKELLPVLWMKANCIGPCPQLESDELPKMLVLPDNKFAVLIDETYYAEFDEKLMEHPEIQTIYIITDSESAYREMIRSYEGKDCYQLYRDYIDNFRINTGR
jgi:adenine-specific DNA-methyltransferase